MLVEFRFSRTKRCATLGAIVLTSMLTGGYAQAQSCSAPQNFDALSGTVKLPPNCVYNTRINIAASNTTLDCNGSVFDGKGQIDIGLMIDAQNQPLNDITIRNCIFRNYTLNAIRVAIRGPKPDREDSYRRAPHNVTITSSTIEGGRVGVYIAAFSNNITVSKSTIRGAEGTGLYLDYSSRENLITENLFTGNGFKDGQPKREALAIDSSYNNKIIGNTFQSNGKGGIFLYKNCGEQEPNAKRIQRTDHSDNNEISRNRFIDETVGVWVASRQSANLSKWGCLDQSMDKSGAFYEDFANHNLVTQNQFCGIRKVAVRVEGDDNQVTANMFDRRTKAMVDIPITKRGELLSKPPARNKVADNNVGTCSSR